MDFLCLRGESFPCEEDILVQTKRTKKTKKTIETSDDFN